MTRREFLKKLPAISAGGLLAADFAQAYRFPKPDFQPTPTDSQAIEGLATKLSGKIHLVGQTPTLIVRQERISPKINPLTIARCLCLTAFLDGGKQELEKVFGIYQNTGLQIRIDPVAPDSDTSTTAAAFAPPVPYIRNQPPTIFLFSDILKHIAENEQCCQRSVDELFFHEIYHAVQYARDPEHSPFFAIIAKFTFYPIISSLLVSGVIYESLAKESTTNQNRGLRHHITTATAAVFASSVLGTVFGPIFETFTGVSISPHELEAYAQTGGVFKIPPGFTNKPELQALKGKFLTFTKV